MEISRSQLRNLQFPSLGFIAVLIGICATGCGEKASTVSVNGNVVYRGQALTHGSVTFFPTIGRAVNAPLSTDGAYGAELEPGDYAVTVSYTEPLPAGYKEGDPVPPPKIVLPPEYNTSAKSTLKATVSQDQSQPIDFKLE